MTDDASPLIDVNRVSHAHDERVLQNIDWTIQAGERWAVLGASGAGKTTLVELVSGLTPPNRGGIIKRNGREQLNLAEWRRNVGWLSADLLDRVPAHQSVLDTVIAGKHSQTLKAERSGLTYSSGDERVARDLLDRVGLGNKDDRQFGDLSQGESQLAFVARSFMGDPELLILDEPCAGLDPGAREHFLSELQAFLVDRSGTAVVYVTHHVEEILPSFGHLLALKDGSVVYSGEKAKFLEQSTLEEVYGTGFDLREDDGRYWPVGVP